MLVARQPRILKLLPQVIFVKVVLQVGHVCYVGVETIRRIPHRALLLTRVQVHFSLTGC